MIKHLRHVVGFLALLAAGALVPAFAALTDLSTAPLASTTSAQVKPNVMLLMDTSGSMGWGHMPDEVETVTGIGSVGYKSAQCNVLYFNPNQTYLLPKKYDGTLFDAPSFTDAPYAGFASFYASADSTDQSRTNLATSFQAYDRKTLRTATNATRADGGDGDTKQPAYYYVYTGSQTLSYKSAPCTDTDTGVSKAATGGGQWTRVDVSTASAATQASFAVWYSFYRTRISLTKSAASLAFTPLTDTFRVGFITVFPKTSASDTSINTANYLKISDFNAQQRNDWFAKLFSQSPKGSSPAREGLARVGRMYAGKHDGINSGMTDDPVQYSCQQNFAIMTTDGYWNTQDESPNGGPVKIDGATLVGQQDGTLVPITVDPNSLTPRPIWDGTIDGTAKVENYTDAFSYLDCGSYFNRSTTQSLRSTTQNLQSTSQTTQSTVQNLQSTSQALASTSQNLRSTSQSRIATSQTLQSTTQILTSTNQNLQSTTQMTSSTSQLLKSTTQKLQSTNQNLKSTSQPQQTTAQTTQTVTVMRQSTVQNLRSTTQTVQSTAQTTASTSQTLQSTRQNLQSTTQNLQSTSQIQQSTSQILKSTNQPLRSTSQMLQSTSQTTQSTSQVTQSTSQVTQSTSQMTISTVQLQRSTSQTQSCDAHTETCTYVKPSDCTASRYNSCSTTTTGPTLVATCTAQSAATENNYLEVTCTSNRTGPTGTASCSPAGATAANNYTTTTCDPVTTGPTAVASCTPQSISSGNGYTTTTCATTTTGPTPVASCTSSGASAGNGYTKTTCNTATTGPTAVASCSASGPTAANGYTTTSCGSNPTSNVAVASCSPSTASNANNFTTTTCTPVTTGPTAVASCTPQSASSSNSYTATTCSANSSGPTPIDTCTPVTGVAGNSYTTTSCNTATTGPTGVAACSPAGANSSNGYVATSCNTVTTGPTAVASCSPAGASGSNAYTATTCSTNNSTNVPVASCTAASANAANSYTTTTCPAPTINTSNVPVASCTPAAASSSNSYTSTTCSTATTGPTGVASCSQVAASSANNYTATTCGSNTTSNVGVASCSASGASSSNGFTTTTCPAPITTTNVPIASCVQSSASAANSWTTTTCSTNNTSNVAVANCSASSASAANNWTTTTCSPTVTGPTVVASCTPSSATAANNYQQTTCGNNTNTTAVASCTPSGPTSANNYTTTTCPAPLTTTNVPVASCTPSGPTAANSYTTTTCPAPVTTTNVPVASCTASGPTGANNYTSTTCPTPITTTDVPSSSCSTTAAAAGNSYTATSCRTATTGPTGVAACTPATASSTNNYVATTCAPNNTTNQPVASCTPSAPTPANGYTTTTCPTPNATSNVPSASCTPATASSANSYTTTTCPTPVTTSNVPVASCTPATAGSANNYTTTTCPTPTTGPTPVASCTASGPTAANNYTTTTCPTLVANNTPVASCTPSGPTAANSYTTTTCPAPATTTNVPVASCTPSSATSANNYVATTCPSPVTTTNVPVASCTASPPTAANNYVATTCPGAASTTNVPTASCTPSGPTAANGYVTTTCPVVVANNVPTASCTPSGPTSANHYVTTICPAAAVTTNVPVASCTAASPTAANNYTTTTCGARATGPDLIKDGSCVPGTDTNFVNTTCTQVYGKQLQYTQTHSVSLQAFSGGLPVSAPSVSNDVPTGPYLLGQCVDPGSPPSSPPNPPPLPTPPSGCTSGWPCTTTQTAGAGSSNALADVAQYYYATDLRPTSDWPTSIAANNVPSVGTGAEDDRVQWQHMTTFTIGLGVSGTLNYQSDYLSAATGDFASIRTGVSTSNSDGSATATTWPLWPDPAVDYTNFNNWNNPKSIDDFWHTAVNGRGKYFSAGDPTSVIAGLSGALVGVQARLSSGAAAGISTAQPTSGGDNRVYVGLYTTSDWTGDVEAHDTDLSTGLPSTKFWSAQPLLDAKTGAACDGRNIYLMHGGTGLVNFSAGNVARCDGTFDTSAGLDTTELANFALANAQLLSQWPSMTSAQQAVTPGANLVNFLRGQRGREGFTAGDVSKLYRSRRHVLGDVVDAQPVVVKDPSFGYADAGYAQFAIDHTGRTPMVYVAANDGMLHAFYAGTTSTDVQGGQEAWAVIPSTVLPLLYKLADDNYRNIHQFSVDGTPVVADVHGASGWRTVLVAGLNDGGKGYYALDVTDPASPRALWEFKSGGTCHAASETGYTSDCYLGYTYGKPVVSKLANGTWVVMFTSGYNNLGGGAGDGQGYLYVVDAINGTVISRISTGAGSAATPSGLAQINNYVENGAIDNTTLYVYGGDLLGNIWRFNFSGTPTVTRLGTAKDSSGTAQPITVRPELAELNGKPMVLAGTGRLLGPSDISDRSVQSVYGVVDQLTGSPVYTDLRASLAPLTMTLSTDGLSRTIACAGSATACGSANGWVADFPPDTGGNPTGERVNIDMRLAASTLVIGSNIPQSDACSTGGSSWLTSLDFATGLAVAGSSTTGTGTGTGGGVVSTAVSSDSLLTGFNVLQLPTREFRAVGELSGRSSVPPTGGGTGPGPVPTCTGQPGEPSCKVNTNQTTPPTKRISWREILQ